MKPDDCILPLSGSILCNGFLASPTFRGAHLNISCSVLGASTSSLAGHTLLLVDLVCLGRQLKAY